MTTTFRYALPMWETAMRAQGRSDNTRRNYLRAANQFADWLDDHGHDGDVATIGSVELNGWIADRREAGLSPATLRIDHTALVSYFKYLTLEEVIASSPMARVERPRVPLPPVDVIDDTDLKALFRACRGRGFNDRRDTAMFRLLLDSGMRKAELASLKVDDIDVTRQVAGIVGKGDKHRVIAWGDKTAAAINSYLLVRGQHPHAAAPDLWLGQRGPLTGDGIAQILKARCREADIDDLHLHQFRHTFASKFRERGGNDTDLMTLGGWSTMDMIAVRYGASRREQRAIEAHRRYAPGDDF